MRQICFILSLPYIGKLCSFGKLTGIVKECYKFLIFFLLLSEKEDSNLKSLLTFKIFHCHVTCKRNKSKNDSMSLKNRKRLTT